MNRSGYHGDVDFDNWQLIRYRGAVEAAFKGKRGQSFLKDLLAAMDAMPEKKLIAGALETADGAVCAIGALGKARGVDMTNLDPEDIKGVAGIFGIAEALAREVVYANDDFYDRETPGQRWQKMRDWIASEIREGSV